MQKLREIVRREIINVLQEDYDLDVNDEDAEDFGHENKIEIECSPFAAKQLIPLIKEIEYMGNIGASRQIKIDDYDNEDSFGFDGDGSSKIGSVKLNGEEIERDE